MDVRSPLRVFTLSLKVPLQFKYVLEITRVTMFGFFCAFPKCSINTIGLRHTKSRFNSLQSETRNARIRHFLHDLAI